MNEIEIKMKKEGTKIPLKSEHIKQNGKISKLK